MSTKIYNGYKLPLMSLSELQSFTMNIRNKFKDAANDIFYHRLAADMAAMIDDVMMHGIDNGLKRYSKKGDSINAKYPAFFSAYRYIEERFEAIRKTNRRDPDYDFECSLVYIPIEDKIMALLYSEQESYVKLWRSLEAVSDYHYQNQTDKPDEITQEDWMQRKIDWDIALPGLGIPGENGFIIDLVKKVPYPIDLDWEKLASYIPAHEVRAKNYAADQLTSQKMVELAGDDKEKMLLSYIDARGWLKTDEGMEKLRSATDDILLKILPVFTEEQLSCWALKDFNSTGYMRWIQI